MSNQAPKAPAVNSNDPKILVEFAPEEVSWLADRLHEEWARTLQAATIVQSSDLAEKVQAHQTMQNKLRNRLLDKAYQQGFGNL